MDELKKTDFSCQKDNLKNFVNKAAGFTMSRKENTPGSKAEAPQCQFFVQRKKRLCRMTVKPGRQYCGEHEPQPKEGGQMDKRIPCPNDPKHTCYASKLLKHLAICNARRTKQPPYIVENINAPEAVDVCPRFPLSSYPKDVLANVIDKINHLYAKHVEGQITTEPPSPIHRAVLGEFSEAERAESSRRHLRQVSALLWAAERAPLPAPGTCYVEPGAGKGQLSYYAAHAWCAGTGSRVLAVDRAPLRHKRDNKLRSAPPTHQTDKQSDQEQDMSANRTEAVDVNIGTDGQHNLSSNDTSIEKLSDNNSQSCGRLSNDIPNSIDERNAPIDNINKPNVNDGINTSDMTDSETHNSDVAVNPKGNIENIDKLVTDEIMKEDNVNSMISDSGDSRLSLKGESGVAVSCGTGTERSVSESGDEVSVRLKGESGIAVRCGTGTQRSVSDSGDEVSVRLKGESGIAVSCGTGTQRSVSESGDGVAVRLRADLAHLALEAVPVVAQSAAVVGLAKHLCGVATDYALRCLAAPGVASKTRGLVLATCCHHRSERAPYVANTQLQELGINAEEFNIMLGIVSWATCGDGRSRERRRDDHQEEGGGGGRRGEREETGRRAKALLDWGRVLWLRARGMDARLCYYVPREVSLENVAIVAVRR